MRTYFAEDKRFNSFFTGGANAAWDTAVDNPYDLAADRHLNYDNDHPIAYLRGRRDPTKRTAAQKATDLQQFLQVILGFLRNMYLEWRFKTAA